MYISPYFWFGIISNAVSLVLDTFHDDGVVVVVVIAINLSVGVCLF